MANGVFNIAKGKVAYYGSLPGGSDAIIAVPLEATALVVDATMKDYDTLAAILAGASNEQTDLGRTTLASVTVTVDDSGDKVDIDCADFSYASATGNAVGKIVVCYSGDTGTDTDTDIIPMSYHDFAVTPDGTTINVTVAAGGFISAGE